MYDNSNVAFSSWCPLNQKVLMHFHCLSINNKMA
uniref:Uncharacterized protein n=1 Tax=Rhizophora mucronata TaxID=61149 RepID=A0A2P2QDY9_RHIMU